MIKEIWFEWNKMNIKRYQQNALCVRTIDNEYQITGPWQL